MRPLAAIAALPVACLVGPWPSAPPHAPRAAVPRAAIVSGSTQYGYVEQAYLQQQGYEDGRGHQGYAQIVWSLTGPTGGQYFVEAGGQQKLGRYANLEAERCSCIPTSAREDTQSAASRCFDCICIPRIRACHEYSSPSPLPVLTSVYSGTPRSLG